MKNGPGQKKAQDIRSAGLGGPVDGEGS